MTPRPKKVEGPWQASVGFLPWKVSVFENVARAGTLYLQWRQDGNWKRKSLQRPLRTEKGKIDPEAQAWALRQAEAQYARLVAGVPDAERAPTAPLTLTQGLTRAIDERTGKYPTETPHRKEVVREIEKAVSVLGDLAWAEIKRSHLRTLWRHRILELRADNETGLRGAEVSVSRLLGVASWLRDEELIPADACVPKRTWKQELRADWLELTGERSVPEPKRPRHTLAEMRAIMAKTAEIDPRFQLLMALGAEVRLGQVARCRRPDLDFDHGTVTIHGRKGKRGVVQKLTAGQLRVAKAAIESGYLRELERTHADYPLFPQGQLTGGRSGKPVAQARHADAAPVDRRTILVWFHAAERLADVEPVKGRAAYGLKRAAVDAVKEAGISREGLMASAGWTDTQMADRVYAQQDAAWAREEAAKHRAQLRGEVQE